MEACSVLIVGGGPAGSSCAWGLRDAGLDVAILDRQTFPRDKVCGGWITPQVLTALAIDPAEYAEGRVLQPIRAFRTGWIGGDALETDYNSIVSYGIRRREFDEFLLRRSSARVLEPASLQSLKRDGAEWIVNDAIRTMLVVGAGGHFCPVAKTTGAKPPRENAVVAQEAEFEMDAAQQAGCHIESERPELYFCADIKGYGWCFRKGNFLNIGLGRMDQHRLSEHVAAFVRWLKATGRIAFDIPSSLLGHAYLLYGVSERNVAGDGVLLIGDAAGLAYKQSGEGIRPAIESGLLAAQTITAAKGNYSRDALAPYGALLSGRFGKSGQDWASRIGVHLPSSLMGAIGRRLLDTRWFVRDVVIERWFLHASDPALNSTL
ncbi:MAG TPA: NAD(P)/FAD-dependent oxidoreductase [Bryobacteraceae bacterium]|nr:NAD(P)/FAD-dependent oxidoreductase [Bryobacteraceae bacterium]